MGDTGGGDGVRYVTLILCEVGLSFAPSQGEARTAAALYGLLRLRARPVMVMVMVMVMVSWRMIRNRD
jgi:hypothetical protein